MRLLSGPAGRLVPGLENPREAELPVFPCAALPFLDPPLSLHCLSLTFHCRALCLHCLFTTLQEYSIDGIKSTIEQQVRLISLLLGGLDQRLLKMRMIRAPRQTKIRGVCFGSGPPRHLLSTGPAMIWLDEMPKPERVF